MSDVDISVVCPVGRHAGDLTEVYREYAAVLETLDARVEWIYVFDGPWTGAEKTMGGIRDGRFPVTVLTMANGFGEATALQLGFERARGRFVLTVPDRHQIDPGTLREIVRRLDAGEDMVVTRREPRSDALLNRIQSRVFHGLVTWLTGRTFRDLTCGLRGMTREVALALDLYGDQHRFLPVLALRRGFRVSEIPGNQHAQNTALRLRGPGIYVRRLLDILNIYFLTKFTRKPLRFFGLIGLGVGSVGALVLFVLAVQKIFFGAALAGRPLVLLGALLLVLGVQVMSIGLLGEIIIFLANRREIPDVRTLDAPEDAGGAEDVEGEVLRRRDAI